MRILLKRCFEKCTGFPRYFPEIEFTRESWTHNVFRCYEWLVGRRQGIKAELSATWMRDEFGKMHVTYACHSFESVFALAEQCARVWLRKEWFVPVRIWVPALNVGGGIPFLGSPFMLAIALDVATTSTAQTASPCTWTHTVTGSRPGIMLGGIAAGVTTQSHFTAASFNGVPATNVDSQQITGGGTSKNEASLWYGSAVPGTFTAAMTATLGTGPGIAGNSTSYSGCNSPGTPDAVNKTSGATTGDKTFTVTTVADNCWIYVIGLNQASVSPTLAADQTSRGTVTFTSTFSTILRAEDTNGPLTPAGAQTVGMTVGAGATERDYAIVAASFAPFVPPTVTDTASSLTTDGASYSGDAFSF